MTRLSDPDAEWERHARWWQVNFTEGADLEYSELIIPMLLEHLNGLCRSGATDGLGGVSAHQIPIVLDVGPGEGQVSRAVATRFGWSVLGCDASWRQLTEARRRGGGPAYVRGLATGLPVEDSSVDAAIACLLLEHVADLESAFAELARVLRPGGRLLVVLNHPIVATPGSGWIDDHTMDPPEQYWQLGPYLTEGVSVEPVAQGVHITFYHRTLSRYLNTARGLGLSLQHMEEPAPPPGFVALAPEYTEQMTMPRMMLLRFERL
jgi:SAM-dependent methyltransferase